MKIRILAGTWCLATVVLANVYSSTLISYVSAPTRQPIIDSIHDIPKVAGLQVAVDKGLGADVVVSVSSSMPSIRIGLSVTKDRYLYSAAQIFLSTKTFIGLKLSLHSTREQLRVY